MGKPEWLSRVPDKIEGFVIGAGGDFQWDGDRVPEDLSNPPRFNKWSRLKALLSSRPAPATFSVGTVMAGYLLIHEMEVRLLGSSFLSQIIPLFILTPGR